jgi:hypothetical protein
MFAVRGVGLPGHGELGRFSVEQVLQRHFERVLHIGALARP